MKTLNTKNLIERFKSIHGDKYDYSKFNFMHGDIKCTIICKKHGEFLQITDSHLRGKGCFQCGKESLRNTKESFIAKAAIVHDNKFDYSKVEYIRNNSNVIIICPLHGEFSQTPHNHVINKTSCPTCQLDRTIYTSITKTGWKQLSKGRTCTLYLLEFSSEAESFYKIGITSTTIKQRFQQGSYRQYDIKIIDTIQSAESELIWKLEKEFQKKLRPLKYIPVKDFHGKYECFKKENLVLDTFRNWQGRPVLNFYPKDYGN